MSRSCWWEAVVTGFVAGEGGGPAFGDGGNAVAETLGETIELRLHGIGDAGVGVSTLATSAVERVSKVLAKAWRDVSEFAGAGARCQLLGGRGRWSSPR